MKSQVLCFKGNRRILDVGGAGYCSFRVMPHQVYGGPSHHMNIRSISVQYMRNNPERFIESNTDHSWLRYLAYMSHQGHGLMELLYKQLLSRSVTALRLRVSIICGTQRF